MNNELGTDSSQAATESAAPELTKAPKFRPRLTKPHRLIQNTQPETTSRDAYGNRIRNPAKGVDIRVSRAAYRFALVVMDRFIKALESRDAHVELTADRHGLGTFARDGHDRIQIHIHEKSKRVEHVSTAAELREKERSSWTKIPKWEDVPTGELVLVPGGVVDLSSDQAIARLVEKAASDVIEELGRVGKKREAEEAVRRREWERQRRIQEEKSRVEAFFKASEALRQYRILADYIEEVRRFGRVPDDQRREGQTLDEWLGWAEAQAQRVHPLGS